MAKRADAYGLFYEVVAQIPRGRVATYGQVARILAVPANSISPWLGRAKDRLKILLQNHQTTNRTVRKESNRASKG